VYQQAIQGSAVQVVKVDAVLTPKAGLAVNSSHSGAQIAMGLVEGKQQICCTKSSRKRFIDRKTSDRKQNTIHE